MIRLKSVISKFNAHDTPIEIDLLAYMFEDLLAYFYSTYQAMYNANK